MPRMAPDDREARRRQFIDAASRCASARSWRDVSVDDVCGEAGLSKGSFYTHFDGKRALLIALLDDGERTLDDVLDGMADSTADAPDVIKRLLRGLLRTGEDPARRQIRADLWAAAAADEDVRARMGERIAERRRRLAAWTERAEREGDLAEVPANAFAAVVLALADGLALHAGADPGGFKWVNIARTVEIIVDGLVPARARA